MTNVLHFVLNSRTLHNKNFLIKIEEAITIFLRNSFLGVHRQRLRAKQGKQRRGVINCGVAPANGKLLALNTGESREAYGSDLSSYMQYFIAYQ